MNKLFKEFFVENILQVHQTKSVIAKANLIDGNIPYVTRTVSDNGYMGTCGNIDKVNKGNCITIGAETGVAFYQPVDFVAGNKVYRLCADDLNEKHYLYLAGALNRLTKNYSYSNARIPEKIKKERILLPIKTDENDNPVFDSECKYHDEGYIPDFDYMQERIAELEQERITELEHYLIATGLNDYELTEEDKEMLATKLTDGGLSQDSVSVSGCWKEARKFKICDLFEASNGDTDLQKSHINGKGVDVVSSGLENNGIIGKTDVNAKVFNANSITIDMFGNCFYRDNSYKMVTHARVFSLSPLFKELNELNAQFIVTKFKYLPLIYNYSNMCSWNKIKEDMLSLPIQTDNNNNPIIDSECKYHEDGYIPDWDFMEKYIRAIEKIVVADVVKYKDEVIALTKVAVA